MARKQRSGTRTMWQSVAASLLLMLLGALATPFVQAQDPDLGVPPCCRMLAGHAGCSMHAHREMMRRALTEQQHAHQWASLELKCPCTAMVSASRVQHDAALTNTGLVDHALPQVRAPGVAVPKRFTSTHTCGKYLRGPPFSRTA